MKKILSINTTSFFSTGAIIKNIENALGDKYEFYHATADAEGDKSFTIIKSSAMREWKKVPSQLFGEDGFLFKKETKELINWIDSVKPDLIHIHNLHGYYTNSEMIMNYAFEHNIPVIFTMHDCWTFTGRCAYFDSVGCEKWKTGCGNCKYKKSYPKTRLFDLSKKQWLKKKRLFSGHNITFVAPSEWLRRYTKESFLKDENVLVINNGIQTDIFAEKIEGYCLPQGIDANKKIILSVAYPFTPQKGLNDINKLQNLIDQNKYQIVVVGITDEFKTMDGIIRVNPTKDKRYLAFLYQHAYVFVSFTYQDNYPTVLLETIAAGTPAIAYDIGGCPEIVIDGKTGYCVPVGDVEKAYERINEIDSINKDKCKKIGLTHSIENFTKEYEKLYKSILDE